jgi:DNA-binding XRE family transcriptional regulator
MSTVPAKPLDPPNRQTRDERLWRRNRWLANAVSGRRCLLGWTQSKTARAIGITAAQLSNIERDCGASETVFAMVRRWLFAQVDPEDAD